MFNNKVLLNSDIFPVHLTPSGNTYMVHAKIRNLHLQPRHKTGTKNSVIGRVGDLIAERTI